MELHGQELFLRSLAARWNYIARFGSKVVQALDFRAIMHVKEGVEKFAHPLIVAGALRPERNFRHGVRMGSGVFTPKFRVLSIPVIGKEKAEAVSRSGFQLR